MRTLTVLLMLACAACTAGCMAGPATSGCSDADLARAAPPVGPSGAAAIASGGQRGNLEPTIEDVARVEPNVVVGRGAGPTSSSQSRAEGRSLAGGPVTNQGLINPVGAAAQGGTGGCVVSPAVTTLQAVIRQLQEDAKVACAMGDREQYRAIQQMIADRTRDLVAASSASSAQTTHNYYLQGARTVQAVVSRNASEHPDSAMVRGTTTDDTAARIAEAMGPAGVEAMRGGADDRSTSPDAPATPEAFPEPAPAGPSGDPFAIPDDR